MTLADLGGQDQYAQLSPPRWRVAPKDRTSLLAAARPDAEEHHRRRKRGETEARALVIIGSNEAVSFVLSGAFRTKKFACLVAKEGTTPRHRSTTRMLLDSSSP
jgi:hypothetical protein